MGDILTFGRDPDQPPFWERHRRLRAAALAAVLICAGVCAGVLGSQRKPPTATSPPQPLARLLSGVPLRPGSGLGALLLGGPAGVRLLKVSDQAHGRAGSPPDLSVVTASNAFGPNASIEEISAVSGGVVTLLIDEPHIGEPAVGEVWFIPVTRRGAGAPHLIAEASHVAVALNQRDVWVEQIGSPPGRDGRAWLVDISGRRLSAVLQLHRQILLAATVAGLLIQGPPGQGASLINPATGRIRPAGIPADALLVADGADDVAWIAASCAHACSLHITSLRNRTDTAIPLPAGAFPGTNSPPPAGFDPAGQRLALAMDITNREDRITGTSVYLASLSSRQLIRLPGGPIPLSAVPGRADTGPAGGPAVVSVRWAGSGLWIVATSGEDWQAAYWPGRGPLRVIAPSPGAAYTFTRVTG